MQAYVILRGLGEDNRAIELKRIVVAVPEKGLGRRILTETIRMVFEDLHAHRLFLDVMRTMPVLAISTRASASCMRERCAMQRSETELGMICA